MHVFFQNGELIAKKVSNLTFSDWCASTLSWQDNFRATIYISASTQQLNLQSSGLHVLELTVTVPEALSENWFLKMLLLNNKDTIWTLFKITNLWTWEKSFEKPICRFLNHWFGLFRTHLMYHSWIMIMMLKYWKNFKIDDETKYQKAISMTWWIKGRRNFFVSKWSMWRLNKRHTFSRFSSEIY